MTVALSGDMHRGPDTHANRPAATAVGVGTLYECTTHNLIYRSNGSAWSTYAAVLPPAGTTGQALVKNSGTDYDVAWGTVSGGSGIPAWSSYTPVWTATSGTTNVGSTGSLAGAYQQLDKTVLFKLTLVLAGSGISTGTGSWAFTLPVAHASVPSGIPNHGIMLGGYYEDFGNRAYNSPGGRLAGSTSTFEMTYNLNSTSFPAGASIIGATSPFTWGASDNLSIYGMYQAA